MEAAVTERFPGGAVQRFVLVRSAEGRGIGPGDLRACRRCGWAG